MKSPAGGDGIGVLARWRRSQTVLHDRFQRLRGVAQQVVVFPTVVNQAANEDRYVVCFAHMRAAMARSSGPITSP